MSIGVTNSEDEPRNITPDAVNEKQHPPSDKEAHDIALDTSEDPKISSPDKEKSFDSRYELAWRRNIEGVFYTFCFPHMPAHTRLSHPHSSLYQQPLSSTSRYTVMSMFLVLNDPWVISYQTLDRTIERVLPC